MLNTSVGLIFSITLVSILSFMFWFLMMKKEKECLTLTSFECGFTPYFFSRHSFSMQFFLVGIIFVMLDLELCCLMPLMLASWLSLKRKWTVNLFVFSLLLGLLWEIGLGNLDWQE